MGRAVVGVAILVPTMLAYEMHHDLDHLTSFSPLSCAMSRGCTLEAQKYLQKSDRSCDQDSSDPNSIYAVLLYGLIGIFVPLTY